MARKTFGTGLVAFLLFIALMVAIGVVISRNIHSVSDDLYQLFVFGPFIFLGWQ